MRKHNQNVVELQHNIVIFSVYLFCLRRNLSSALICYQRIIRRVLTILSVKTSSIL